MWIIEKNFSLDYGHRVWSQKLDTSLSLDSKLACRHLHGHRGEIVVSLKADTLENGMVTDFKHLNWFKKFIDDTLDHKMILDIDDPAIPDLYPGLISETGGYFLNYHNTTIDADSRYFTVREDVMVNASPAMREVYEGLVFVTFVPTSENLSFWLYKIIKHTMPNVEVHGVTLYETPKSKSRFIND